MIHTVGTRMAAFGALMFAGLCLWAATLMPAGTKTEAGVLGAICPVVYPLDESAGGRGVHYTFYGNAFFINEDGYLLTAAHVLTDFQDGGQPHILVRRPEAPPRVLTVEVVATSPLHDIAILRAVPNPFRAKYAIAWLPLAADIPTPGTAVLAAAIRPSRLRDPHSFDAPQEERSPAGILQYTRAKLDQGQPESELFLFDHEVERGQSGAPILARETEAVLGIVEGQWLRGITVRNLSATGKPASNIGAAIPITYALPLLEAKHIPWRAAGAPGS